MPDSPAAACHAVRWTMVGHTCELQGDSATLPVMLKAMTVLHAKPMLQAEAVPPGGMPPHEVALSSADSLWRVESCDSIRDPIHVPIHDSAAATEFATGPQQGEIVIVGDLRRVPEPLSDRVGYSHLASEIAPGSRSRPGSWYSRRPRSRSSRSTSAR